MDWIIILAIWVACCATGFWEAYVEGMNYWDKGKLGWKIKTKKQVWLTAYHFWLFWVMYPALLFIPLYMSDFSFEMVKTIGFGYFIGAIIEDFTWFIANPLFKLKDWGPKKVVWYPWIKFTKNTGIPTFYVAGFVIAGVFYFI